MSRLLNRRNLLRFCLTGTALAVAGCGTILYPERRGQPPGRIDWRVVGLDALCLLFFFIPGVIAFAVDFATGAIYMPCYCAGNASGPNGDRQLTRIDVPRSELTPEGISRIVAQHACREVDLTRDNFETRPLNHIEEFWTTQQSLAG